MSQDEVRLHDEESDGKTFNGESTEEPQQNYQDIPKHPPLKGKWPWKYIVLIIVLNILILYLIYLYIICSGFGGLILDSAEFYYDSEAEIELGLIDELYHNLDFGSRMNVTNETYFLVLSIPELEYSIRFDYIFEFDGDNLTNLKIEQHLKVPKITSFERRMIDLYNLSIEFKINSTDPDILNVSVFPPDNIIYGELMTYHTDSWTFTIILEEGEFKNKNWDDNIRENYLILPYNQRIVVKSTFHHICPFK